MSNIRIIATLTLPIIIGTVHKTAKSDKWVILSTPLPNGDDVFMTHKEDETIIMSHDRDDIVSKKIGSIKGDYTDIELYIKSVDGRLVAYTSTGKIVFMIN